MISFKYFFYKLKDVKISDLFAFFKMLVAVILIPLYKKKYNGAWLICEEPYEARDNGFVFYKYLRIVKEKENCFYAIKRSSVDYQKVATLGHVLEYGSIQHWLAYFLCSFNISSQKGGKPNAALCSFFELVKIFKTKNIFLQHGIIINNLEWLYADKSKIDLFITSTIPEYKYVCERFGYDISTIQLTGLPRFDELHNLNVVENQILIMPTWRYWFNLRSKSVKGEDANFETSEYLNKWQELLNSEYLTELINRYNLKVIFYPHRNMQKYLGDFTVNNKNIIVADWRNYDIQKLLKESRLMITDYSSVFFDMIYMKKNVIFYQFDIDKYRSIQYKEGYFDYSNNPFADSFTNSKDVLKKLADLIQNEYGLSETFEKAFHEYFKYYDMNNCKRVYDRIESMNL